MQSTQVRPEQSGIAAETPENLRAVSPGESYLADWDTWMEVSRGLSPNTRKLYRRSVESAQRDLGDLLEQTTESLERWVQSKKGSAGTVANRISALTSYYRFLVKSKHLPANPASELDRPRQRRGVPKPVADLDKVLDLLDEVDRRANLWGASERKVGESRAMATFLAETGLRIHEAVALEVPGPCPRSVPIIGKGNKEAIILLTESAREAMDFLGGRWPIGARATQRRFKKAGTHPHAFRHLFATRLVQKGVEIGTVSKLCRHSSPAITMGYAAYATDLLWAALEK